MVAGERPGAIVAVTSVSGFLTDRAMAHYSVSKAGLAALVRVAARELGPHGIRVNAVAPGTTDTPMFAATDAHARLPRAGRGPVRARPGRARRPRSRRRSSRCARSTGSPARSSRPTAACRSRARSTPPTEPEPAVVSAGVRAVVFDFDGLILDTEVPVYASWCAAFDAHGAAPPTIEEWAAEIGTIGGLDLEAWLARAGDRPVDLDAMHDARRAHCATRCSQVEAVRPGVEAWLDEADAPGYGVAIASSSRRELGASSTSSGSGCATASPTSSLPAATLPAEARARHLSRGVRATRCRRSARARGRGLAARDRGREGGRPALRRGAARDHRDARSLGRRPARLALTRRRARLADVQSSPACESPLEADVAASAATAPRAVALPLVERPRHLVLVVRRRVRRQHADEVEPARVRRGDVPGGRRELVGAVVPGGAHDGVVAAALTRPGAHEERVVVVRADRAGVGRRGRGRWRRAARARR